MEDYEVMTTGTDARKNVLADVTKTDSGLSQKDDDMGNNYKIISSEYMAESYEVMTFKSARSDQTSTSKLISENESPGTNNSINDERKLTGETHADNSKDNLSCASASSCNSETVSKV